MLLTCYQETVAPARRVDQCHMVRQGNLVEERRYRGKSKHRRDAGESK